MRKKLLALLMCATMVLGTGVTAFADVYDDAKKIGGENANNFVNEIYPTIDTIVDKTSNGSKGYVEYGYEFVEGKSDAVFGDYTPVVVYKDSKDVYQKATKATPINAFVGKSGSITVVAGTEFKTQKAELEKIFGETAVKTMVTTDANGKDAFVIWDTTKNATTTKNALDTGDVVCSKSANETYYKAFTVAASYTAEPDYKAAAQSVVNTLNQFTGGTYAVTVYDFNLGKDNKTLYQVTAGTSSVTVVKSTTAVKNTANYIQEPVTDAVLVAGSKDILKSTDGSTVWANVTAAGKDYEKEAVVSALNDKTFSKDAVAVKISAYLQMPYATADLGIENKNIFDGNVRPLKNINNIQAGTYTFDADLISRLGFKDASAVDVFQASLVAAKLDMENGTYVKDFGKVATVKVDGTITFDHSGYTNDGVFVFDKGELAEEPTTENNDGVSDAATTVAPAADANTAASPKTGDVAPIAALAVVMMGACGAMVVASKKRA